MDTLTGPGAEALGAMLARSDGELLRMLAARGLVAAEPGGEGGHLAARALKAAFFEAVLDSPRRPTDGTRSLLVADEFHRFVTADPWHGEQSFLDTCRSFGANCVLACQGVSSLRLLESVSPDVGGARLTAVGNATRQVLRGLGDGRFERRQRAAASLRPRCGTLGLGAGSGIGALRQAAQSRNAV